MRIAPILPVVVSRQPVLVKPDSAIRRLSHLGPACGRQEGAGQPEQFGLVQPTSQIGAADDVAPLVGTAHLQAAIMAPRQFQKVVGLQHHVIEFQEGKRLLPFQPQFH